jgi:hypothetical protein
MVVDKFEINCEVRISKASQRGRPFDSVVDQFGMNCVERIH